MITLHSAYDDNDVLELASGEFHAFVYTWDGRWKGVKNIIILGNGVTIPES